MDLLTIAKKIADRVEAESLKQNVPDAIRRNSAGNALSLDRCPQPHVNRTADARQHGRHGTPQPGHT
jgi:hypothetical protein